MTTRCGNPQKRYLLMMADEIRDGRQKKKTNKMHEAA